MKKNDKKPLTRKTGKGYHSRSCVGNQQHYLSKLDPGQICLLCGKLTASAERDVLKEVFNGKEVSVCYDDLRNLSKMKEFYFPILPSRMPKYFNLTEYFKEIKKLLLPKTMGDEKTKKTLRFIQKTFYKGSTNKFLKTFFFGK